MSNSERLTTLLKIAREVGPINGQIPAEAYELISMELMENHGFNAREVQQLIARAERRPGVNSHQTMVRAVPKAKRSPSNK